MAKPKLITNLVLGLLDKMAESASMLKDPAENGAIAKLMG
jgi:hypothetical protein